MWALFRASSLWPYWTIQCCDSIYYYISCSDWVPFCESPDLQLFRVHWKWWEVSFGWSWIKGFACFAVGWTPGATHPAPVMEVMSHEPKTSNLLQMSTADLGENQSDLMIRPDSQLSLQHNIRAGSGSSHCSGRASIACQNLQICPDKRFGQLGQFQTK